MSGPALPPAWRVAARLARREVRRRPWRTTLVVVLVGLPVAAVTATTATARTLHETAAEELARVAGQADDYVEAADLGGGTTFPRAVVEAYPEGSRFTFVTTAPDGVTGDDGHLHAVGYSDHPVADPLLQGLLALTEGRAPRATGEVAVTPEVLELAGARLGDRIDLFRTGAVRVTGVVRFPGDFARRQVIGTVPPPPHPAGYVGAFVVMPAGSAGPDRSVLDEVGAYDSRQFLDGQGAREELRGRLTAMYVAAGVLLAVVAIVASSAFAVGARRQLRTLGLLAASGAPPATLRRTVLLQGTVMGVVGSVVGVALGMAVAATLHPFLDDIEGRAVGSRDVAWLDLVAAVLLGTATATAAAWFPARSAGRVPVLAALAGRRPAGRVPAALPLAGAVTAAAAVVALGIWARQPQQEWRIGLVSALTLLGGSVALAPWLVSQAEPLARRLRGSARLAARDLARQRLRSAAVVAAVMAPAGLSVVGAVAVATGEARADVEHDRGLRDDEVLVDFSGGDARDAEDVIRAVAGVLPGAVQVELGAASDDPAAPAAFDAVVLETGSGGGPSPDASGPTEQHTWPLQVVDPAVLGRIGFPDRTVDALEDGKVVLPSRWPDRAVEVGGADVPLTTEDVVRAHGPMPYIVEGGLVSPTTVERWGLDVVPVAVLFRAPEPPSEEQLQALRRIAERGCHWVFDSSCDDTTLRAYLRGEGPGTFDTAWVVVPSDGDEPLDDELVLTLVAAGGSLLFTLVVVAVALALTAAESRDERALLNAVGAGPEARRSLAAWQALLLPAMAMLLAVPIALVVGWVLQSEPHVSGVGPQVPWLTLALLVVGLPLATSGVAWLGATLTGRRHRDLSTLALAAD